MKNIYNELRRHTDIVETLKKQILLSDFTQMNVLDSRFTSQIISAHTTTLDTTRTDINNTANLNWLMPATATTLDFVSTSTEDGGAGAGITFLAVFGLDQNLNEITDFVALNGTTTVTSNLSFRAMNLALAVAGGTPGSGAVGIVSITATTGGQAFGNFLVDETGAEPGRYTVPNGKRLLLTGTVYNGGDGADMTLIPEITILGGFPFSVGNNYISGLITQLGNTNLFLDAGTTFKWRGFTNSGSPGTRKLNISLLGQLATNEVWATIPL